MNIGNLVLDPKYAMQNMGGVNRFSDTSYNKSQYHQQPFRQCVPSSKGISLLFLVF